MTVSSAKNMTARLLLLAAALLVMTAGTRGQELLAPPDQVRFNSTDYRNILHWNPPGNQSLLHYHVQWKIYGEPEWLDVTGCRDVPEPRCDLSGVTADPSEWYYARVSASSPSSPHSASAWTLSPRFSPRWETKISPPTIKLHIGQEERRVQVQVKVARGPLRRMRKSLYVKIYRIKAGGEEEEFHLDCCSGRLTLPRLRSGLKFCLQAQTFILSHLKSSERSSALCISAP